MSGPSHNRPGSFHSNNPFSSELDQSQPASSSPEELRQPAPAARRPDDMHHLGTAHLHSPRNSSYGPSYPTVHMVKTSFDASGHASMHSVSTDSLRPSQQETLQVPRSSNKPYIPDGDDAENTPRTGPGGSADQPAHLRSHSPGTIARQRRHISFAASTQEEINFSDEIANTTTNNLSFLSQPHGTNDSAATDLERDASVKRHRWGTVRQKNRPKRTKSSMFKKRVSSGGMGPDGGDDHHHHHHHFPGTHKNESDESLGNLPTQPAMQKVFFNMPLSDDLLDPETGIPTVQYPRNKVRTTKYTPLSFIPKNLYYQFQNIANVYFLLIVILGVSPAYLSLPPYCLLTK